MVSSQKQRSKPPSRKGKQVDRIVFDEEARREYLTGFHKRKVQKKEAEKKAAIARQKRIRRETRAENRRELAERAKENARLVEQAYGGYTSEDASEEGRSASEEREPVEYEDEEQLATVTVVEDFNIEDLAGADGPSTGPSTRYRDQPPKKFTSLKTPKLEQAVSLKQKRITIGASKTKKRRPDFHYSTKSERLLERAKQLAKRKRGDNDNPKGKIVTRRRIK